MLWFLILAFCFLCAPKAGIIVTVIILALTLPFYLFGLFCSKLEFIDKDAEMAKYQEYLKTLQ
jgi:hypothetical protein